MEHTATILTGCALCGEVTRHVCEAPELPLACENAQRHARIMRIMRVGVAAQSTPRPERSNVIPLFGRKAG